MDTQATEGNAMRKLQTATYAAMVAMAGAVMVARTIDQVRS